MNVEIGAEASQFPEKEYINGIAVAVWSMSMSGPVMPMQHCKSGSHKNGIRKSSRKTYNLIMGI
jgi:hypothetical protein